MRRFLITGGVGFVGCHVPERLLRAGHAVVAYDDLNGFYDPKLKAKNILDLKALGKAFTMGEGCVTDGPALERALGDQEFDRVLHLAARAGVRRSSAEPALYQRVNAEGSACLSEAARRAGVRKIVASSSSSVYGVNAKVPFSETDPIVSVISPCAASKLA